MTQRGTENDFSDRLKSARQKAGLDQPPPSPAPPLGLASYAFRLATELVAGVLVGGGVGWAIDRVAHTSPFGLIVCILLGFLGGMLNVLRAVKQMNAQLSVNPAPAVPDDEDED
jgi:ATP synthase protein I